MAARDKGAARILMMGAHVIKAGASRHVIDLIERGYMTHVAMNGAGSIHDYELARIGASRKAWRATSAAASSACGGRPAI